MDYLRTDLKTFQKRHLFRVQYPRARTKFTPGVGFEAQDTITFYNQHQIHEGPNGGLLSAITKHLNWNTMYGSSFVALFGSKHHALKWAMKRCMSNGKACEVLTIDVKKLGDDAYAFNAGEIAEMLSLDIYQGAKRSVKDEFLIAWRVPEDAIIRADIVRRPDQEARNHCKLPFGLLGVDIPELLVADKSDQLVDELRALDLGEDCGLKRLYGDC